MALRNVHTNKEVLESAIIDGINRFLRDFAEPRGLMGKTQSTSDKHFLMR